MKTPAVLAIVCLLCAAPAWAAPNDSLTTPEQKAAMAKWVPTVNIETPGGKGVNRGNKAKRTAKKAKQNN